MTMLVLTAALINCEDLRSSWRRVRMETNNLKEISVVRQTFHMKYQALFYQKKKKIENVICSNFG